MRLIRAEILRDGGRRHGGRGEVERRSVRCWLAIDGGVTGRVYLCVTEKSVRSLRRRRVFPRALRFAVHGRAAGTQTNLHRCADACSTPSAAPFETDDSNNNTILSYSVLVPTAVDRFFFSPLIFRSFNFSVFRFNVLPPPALGRVFRRDRDPTNSSYHYVLLPPRVTPA